MIVERILTKDQLPPKQKFVNTDLGYLVLNDAEQWADEMYNLGKIVHGEELIRYTPTWWDKNDN